MPHLSNKVLVLALLVVVMACEDDDHVQYYAIKYEIDVDSEDSMDYQEKLKTNSQSECNKDSNVDVKKGVRSDFMLIIYYHSSSGYELVGTHQVFTEPADDPHYRHGFFARYHYCSENQECSDSLFDENDPIAQSGTVTVKEKDGELEIDYDIVFTEDLHEIGHWKMEQCGEAEIVNP